MADNVTHTYHHDDDRPRFNVKAEKNSRGYNFEATVTNAPSIQEAMELLNTLTTALEAQYGRSNPA